IVDDALALLARPDFEALFAPGSLAETPVAGAITLRDGTSRLVSGQIDRLAVSHNEVLIADFKTAATPPRTAAEIPATTLAQLAVYQALLAQIYPGRRIRTLALYTASLTAFEPEDALLQGVLAAMTG
ncbi:MAG: PD-(D/E)XK nuclease family protein, partial [Bosea sp. (in: a-proteobacteria)]